MGAIFYRAFSDGTFPYLTLAGDEYIRPLEIGSDWTTLKIGMVCALTPITPGVDITGIDLFLGVTNYAGGSWAGANCANAVGMGFYTGFYPGTANWVGPSHWTLSNTAWNTRIAGVITRSNSGFTNFPIRIIGGRWLFSIALTKSGTFVSYTISTSSPGTWTYRDMVDFVEQPGNPTVVVGGSSVTFSPNTSTPTVFNDSAGPLNALNIYWNRISAPLEIYGIAVARLA